MPMPHAGNPGTLGPWDPWTLGCGFRSPIPAFLHSEGATQRVMSFLFSNTNGNGNLKSLNKKTHTIIKFKPFQGFQSADQFFNYSTSFILTSFTLTSFTSLKSFILLFHPQIPRPMESNVSSHGTQFGYAIRRES